MGCMPRAKGSSSAADVEILFTGDERGAVRAALLIYRLTLQPSR